MSLASIEMGGHLKIYIFSNVCSLSIPYMAPICTTQAWAKSEVSEAEWSDQWSQAAMSLYSTGMSNHLGIISFPQFYWFY